MVIQLTHGYLARVVESGYKPPTMAAEVTTLLVLGGSQWSLSHGNSLVSKRALQPL